MTVLSEKFFDSRTDLFKVVAWIIAATLLVIVLKAHLLVALLAGLLIYELVHLISPVLISKVRINSDLAKLSVVLAISIIIISIVTLIVFLLIKAFHAGNENLSELLKMMADVLDNYHRQLPNFLVQYLPSNIHDIQIMLTDWLKNNAIVLKTAGKGIGISFVHALVGMVIGMEKLYLKF